MRRAAEMTIAVSVVLRISRKLRADVWSERAERMQQTDASDQVVRDQDQRMSALEHLLDLATVRAAEAEERGAKAGQQAQARVAAAEARSSRELELGQREVLRRERAAERGRDEAELRCEALQAEAAMLRAMLPEEVHAQVPCTPQPKGWGVRSAQLKKSEGSEGSEVTETVRGQSRGPSRGQSLFHQRARTSLAQGSVSSASSRAISLPRDGTPRGGDGRLLPISISPISSATRSKLDGLVGELQRVQPQPPQHSRGGDDAEGDHTTRSSQMQWLMERAEIAEVEDGRTDSSFGDDGCDESAGKGGKGGKGVIPPGTPLATGMGGESGRLSQGRRAVASASPRASRLSSRLSSLLAS